MRELYKQLIRGDWGLGIGDWAQSPIPNPQSPFKLNNKYNSSIKLYLYI